MLGERNVWIPIDTSVPFQSYHYEVVNLQVMEKNDRFKVTVHRLHQLSYQVVAKIMINDVSLVAKSYDLGNEGIWGGRVLGEIVYYSLL